MREFEWIDWIGRRSAPAPPGWIGIGDDAALVRARGALVVTTDAIVEGIDFDDSVAKEAAGRKALAVNLSDLAAMAARPVGFLLVLGVPPAWNGPPLSAFLGGLFRLARRHRLPCLGGDLSAAERLFCAVTLFGSPPPGGVVTRSGARPGDLLYATGTFGGSIGRRHWAFRPRIEEAAWLARNCRPSAMIDVSDGLAQDLGHLLRASRVSARVDLERIPLSAAVRRLHAGSAAARLAALSDGEDFELLFTLPARRAGRLERKWRRKFPRIRLSPIGRIEAGPPAVRWRERGAERPGFIAPAGFSHFRSEASGGTQG